MLASRQDRDVPPLFFLLVTPNDVSFYPFVSAFCTLPVLAWTFLRHGEGPRLFRRHLHYTSTIDTLTWEVTPLVFNLVCRSPGFPFRLLLSSWHCYNHNGYLISKPVLFLLKIFFPRRLSHESIRPTSLPPQQRLG